MPLTGVSKTKTLFCNEGGYFSYYISDKYGFNNMDDFKPDIGLVGDSFTHGACVMPEHNLASNLKKLTELNITNYGMRGIGPMTILAIVKEYVIKQKPKKVLWIHYEGNDLHDLTIENRNQFMRNYLQPNFSQDLANRVDEIDKALLKFNEKSFRLVNNDSKKKVLIFSKFLRQKRFYWKH